MKEIVGETVTKTELDTVDLGRIIAEKLVPGDIVAIAGPLGVGKTTLIRGICAKLGISDVSSPTFTIVNSYDVSASAIGKDFIQDHKPEGKITVSHIDLYRITDEKEFLERGISDYLGEDDTITIVEWADHFPEYFQNKGVIWIEMSLSEAGRVINITRRT